MTWGPAILDVLLFVCVLLMAYAIHVYVWGAWNQPAFHIWFMAANRNAGNMLYFCSATTVNLMLGRLGKDGDVYSTVAACLFCSGFLWWFINYTHKQALKCFVDDCHDHLPGSCEFCVYFRAGKHYGFWKKPIPEHPDCREAR